MNRQQKRWLMKNVKNYKKILQQATEKAMLEYRKGMEEKWSEQDETVDCSDIVDAVEIENERDAAHGD